MKKLPNIHPGEILLEESLLRMGTSQNALARGLVSRDLLRVERARAEYKAAKS